MKFFLVLGLCLVSLNAAATGHAGRDGVRVPEPRAGGEEKPARSESTWADRLHDFLIRNEETALSRMTKKQEEELEGILKNATLDDFKKRDKNGLTPLQKALLADAEFFSVVAKFDKRPEADVLSDLLAMNEKLHRRLSDARDGSAELDRLREEYKKAGKSLTGEEVLATGLLSLSSGLTHGSAIAKLAAMEGSFPKLAPKLQEASIQNFYRQQLYREPEQLELDGWLIHLRNPIAYQEATELGKIKKGSAEEKLFLDYLKVAKETFAKGDQLVNSGLGYHIITEGILESPEAQGYREQAHKIKGLYEKNLKREATYKEVRHWLGEWKTHGKKYVIENIENASEKKQR